MARASKYNQKQKLALLRAWAKADPKKLTTWARSQKVGVSTLYRWKHQLEGKK